jgi:hypothetical protein
MNSIYGPICNDKHFHKRSLSAEVLLVTVWSNNIPIEMLNGKCRMILSYDAYQDMKDQQIDIDVLDTLRQEIEGLKRSKLFVLVISKFY